MGNTKNRCTPQVLKDWEGKASYTEFLRFLPSRFKKHPSSELKLIYETVFVALVESLPEGFLVMEDVLSVIHANRKKIQNRKVTSLCTMQLAQEMMRYLSVRKVSPYILADEEYRKKLCSPKIHEYLKTFGFDLSDRRKIINFVLSAYENDAKTGSRFSCGKIINDCIRQNPMPFRLKEEMIMEMISIIYDTLLKKGIIGQVD